MRLNLEFAVASCSTSSTSNIAAIVLLLSWRFWLLNYGLLIHLERSFHVFSVQLFESFDLLLLSNDNSVVLEVTVNLPGLGIEIFLHNHNTEVSSHSL